jgi:hypothetical protein
MDVAKINMRIGALPNPARDSLMSPEVRLWTDMVKSG